jgi:preprotein translocase subunit Sec63
MGPKKQKKENENEKKDNNTLDEVDLMTTVRNNKFNYGVIVLLCFLVFLSLYFQYKYERSKLEGFNPDDEEDNFYEILGVEYGADSKTIKQAYKKLAVIW